MVVVSGSWAKNVPTYPTINDMVMSEGGGDNNKMTAKAVLICRPNSHWFQERTLILDQPVKVGRSVARARAAPNNAIFDCKVLSRHHALLWYENGKFYLQDTKSSNGTFVNNNRLSDDNEHHEVSSGDIVQFGVDVVENNRKVTHGCIIATLKLYLPDGKEAKASPTIVESNQHGFVPLNELYKLHQIIQEATQREQYLETKLSELQMVVEETRKSADESWQAYVGEERLLSRVSALETQLQQAAKNWTEDKFKEELVKLHEDNTAYQLAAKEALEKLHAERLEAVAQATEQERLRITAEQEALLAKEQLEQLQHELEDVALKLTDEQKKSDESRIEWEQQQNELEKKLEEESDKVNKLQLKLQQFRASAPLDVLEKHIIYKEDLQLKKEMLAENEEAEIEAAENKNHINLTVMPVGPSENPSHEKTIIDNIVEFSEECLSQQSKGEKQVTFSSTIQTCQNGSETDNNNEKDDDFDTDQIDSKTLKYKYQTAQNELKKKIELLESIENQNKEKMYELEIYLNKEKDLNRSNLEEMQKLQDELTNLQQKWKECFNENQQLKDKVDELKDQNNTSTTSTISSNNSSYQDLINLEEELVLLKEQHAKSNIEKLKLQHQLNDFKQKYHKVRNQSYNTLYFYIAPLILIILYLVISAMIS